MRRFLFGLAMLGVAIGAHAQTPATVTWVQEGVGSATQAQGFTYRLYVTPAGTTTTNPPVVLTAVLCGGTAPSVSCSLPLPTAAAAATVTGARSELSAADSATGTESARSAPFIFPARVPTNLRITP